MKKKYESPFIEKITFDYTIQTVTSPGDCFESVMNLRSDGSSGEGHRTSCIGGTVIVIGWTKDQTDV